MEFPPRKILSNSTRSLKFGLPLAAIPAITPAQKPILGKKRCIFSAHGWDRFLYPIAELFKIRHMTRGSCPPSIRGQIPIFLAEFGRFASHFRDCFTRVFLFLPFLLCLPIFAMQRAPAGHSLGVRTIEYLD